MKKKLPEHRRGRFGTMRTFRQSKREDIRVLEMVADSVALGSAYLPREAYRLFKRVRADVRKIRELTSVKEWGR